MGEVSILSSSSTVVGYKFGKNFRNPSCCYCNYPCLDADGRPKGRCFNIVSDSKWSNNWYGVAKREILSMDVLFGFTSSHNLFIVNSLANLDSGSVCEEDDEITQGEEDIGTHSYEERKSSRPGSFSSHNSLIIENSGSRELSRGSKRPMVLDEIRLHYLEERNEEILSTRILKLSRSNKFRSALELCKSMAFTGLRPNLHAYNSLLSCLLRNELLDDAFRVFEFMKENEMTSGHSYSLIVKAVANFRGSDAAVRMFKELESTSNPEKDFDAVVYNTVITVCCKENNWFQAQEFWISMKKSGHIGTKITYRLLICTFVRCGRNELALEAYYEMVKHGLNPGDDALHAILGACAKEGKWDLTLSVFKNMLNSGLKPNVIACNTLINSLGKVGKVDLAFKVYGFMKSLGHSPDAYTWNALLGALYRANRHADVLLLFERIQIEYSSALNLHLYNTTLMSCQKLGLWDRALQQLWTIESSGLAVSSVTYNLVIGACEVAKRPEVALQVYEHMVHQRIKPDIFTHLSIMRACIWGSLWDQVEEILSLDGSNECLYNAAVQGLCLRGKIDLAMKLYKKMRSGGLKPDGKTRALVLQKLPKESLTTR